MIDAFKSCLYGTLATTRLDRLLRPIFGGAGAILTFHRILTDPPKLVHGPSSTLVVTEQAFRDLIAFLRKERYDIISLSEVCHRLHNPGTLSKFVSLTFDDGYRDNYEILYPICTELGIPITIYVTTELVEGKLDLWWYGLERVVECADEVSCPNGGGLERFNTRTASEKITSYRELDTLLRLASDEQREIMIAHLENEHGIDFAKCSAGLGMTWSMLKEISRNELVEIGAHTVSHRALSQLPQSEARREIEESRKDIERRLSTKVKHFAYPFGRPIDAGQREFAICRELGFESATTTRYGTISRRHANQLHNLPRLNVIADQTVRTLRTDLSGVPSAVRAIQRSIARN